MRARLRGRLLLAILMTPLPAFAQASADTAAAARYVDTVNGLSLEQATARALADEPSLRSARTEIDAARGMRQQAELRPNPTFSLERRGEPGGTDNLTTVTAEWPLDLFRRTPRVAVADRDVAAAQLAVADRERLLASEVRMRYGEVLASVRALSILDELVAVTGRQHALLRARVEEGATPPLDRDLVDVELRRLEAERLLEAGKTEAALMELKRVLGMSAETTLTVRDTLEELVRRQSGTGAPVNTSEVLKQRPDVREAAARIEASDARIERGRADGRFDMNLVASYMRMDSGFPQRGFGPDGSLERVRGQFHYVSVGAMFRVPLLNQNQGEVAAAQAARAGAEATYQAARLTAETEVAAARARDEHAQKAVGAYGSLVQGLARRNRDVVSQSYELGRVTVFDVLTEQRRYLDVERAYTETLRAAYEARTALNRALGGVR